MKITRATDTADLRQILRLQHDNLRPQLTTSEVRQEGFVTVEHDLPLLTLMNHPHPHIIAKDGDKVVGYALVMTRDHGQSIPVLVPMFEKIDGLLDDSYVVMGQICIDKAYRGQGLFRSMYAYYEQELRPHFTHIVTEIDKNNQRSMQAHLACGFTVLHEYVTDQEWVIVMK